METDKVFRNKKLEKKEKKDKKASENINNNNNMVLDNVPMKKIIYKGKTKEIPQQNPDKKLCENFIISKYRSCKFEKMVDSDYCIYHLPDEKNEILVDCPIDPSHRVLQTKLKKHVHVCNKLEQQNKMKENIWYVDNMNIVKENDIEIENFLKIENISTSNLNEFYDLKWENLEEEIYSNMLDKIIKCYNILKEDYKNYSVEKNLEKTLSDIGKNEYTLSAMEINHEKDFQFTKGLPKLEKNGKQNESIGQVLERFNLIDSSNVYIEFGAGKGGLSYYINTKTENNSIHILLERDGVRYKKDKYSDNLIRVI